MLKLGIDIGASHIGLGLYDTIKKKLTKKKYIPYKAPAKIFNKIFKSITTDNGSEFSNFLGIIENSKTRKKKL